MRINIFFEIITNVKISKLLFPRQPLNLNKKSLCAWMLTGFHSCDIPYCFKFSYFTLLTVSNIRWLNDIILFKPHASLFKVNSRNNL